MLKQKFSHCLAEGSARLQIYLKQSPDSSYFVEYKNKNTYILSAADIRSSFLVFNFYLKTIFASFLLEHDGLIMHSSSIRYEDKAILFAGKEGRGKSTIVKLIPEFLTLNDDFAILRRIRTRFYVFSSPFYEKNSFVRTNIRVPLGRIYFLRQAKVNSRSLVSKDDAAVAILSLLLVPLSFIPEHKWQNIPVSYQKKISASMFRVAKTLSASAEGFVLKFRKDRSFLPLLA